MDEVEVRIVWYAREPRMGPHDPHLVPSGMRHSHVAPQPSHASPVETQARRSGVFLALVEEELHPHAQPQERDAAVVSDTHHDIEAHAAELARAVTEPAHTWKHDGVRLQDIDVRSRNAHVVAAGA